MAEFPSPLVDFDLACIHCGYNLRALAPKGLCPECGKPIEQSARGDLLRYADSDWLRKIVLGLDLMWWAIVGSLLLVIVGGFAAGLMGSSLGPGRVALVMTVAVQAISAGLNVLAVFLITTQEPRLSMTEATWTWRKVLRASVPLSVLCWLFGYGSQIIVLPGLLPILYFVGGLSGVCVTYGGFTYARGFALRLPDSKLARSTTIVKWGLSMFLLLGVMAPIIALTVASIGPAAPATTPALIGTPGAAGGPPPSTLTVRRSSGVGAMGLLFMSCFGAVMFLIFGLWACRLLWRYRKALRAALVEARSCAAMPEAQEQ